MRQAMLQGHFPDKHLGTQPAQGISTSLPSGFIVVQGEQYPALRTYSLDNESLLLDTHGTAHEGDHILSPALPELTDRKESLDDNEAFSCMLSGTVEIEENYALPKIGWEVVLARSFWRITKAPSGIRDKLALLIVYRDDDAIMHDAFAGVMPKPECINGRFPEAPFLEEIGMPGIKVLKGGPVTT